MKNYKPLLGVCPIGKFVFSHEDALIQKNKIFDKLQELKLNYCTIDDVIPDGMIRNQKHAETVTEYFKHKKIDALFVPHCNFGTEAAVGLICKNLNVPVLLWGPRDEAPLPDGSRLRDSLCGMLASSKVLHKLNVPFTYIENCSVDDKKFTEGLSVFIRASSVVKAMRTMRIGQLGIRIEFFWCTIVNESELLDKFGIQVLPIDMMEFLEQVELRVKSNLEEYRKELSQIKNWLITDKLEDENELINGLAFRDELVSIAEKENLDAFSVQSINSLVNALGAGYGLGLSLVTEKIPLADESDIHGAISSVLLNAAKKTEDPVFLPEYTIRHPENNNAVLMWHGSAPLSLKDPEFKKINISAPWILTDLPPVSLQYKMKDGKLTVCRFDGDNGEYILGIGEGKTVKGPYTREYYLWMEVDNWPEWEKKLIEGPYIHHCSCTYDTCSGILEEACKYIPGLKSQRYDK